VEQGARESWQVAGGSGQPKRRKTQRAQRDHSTYQYEERKETMKSHKFLRITLALTIVASFALAGCAQRPAQAPSGGAMKSEGTKVTVKGKIGYMKSVSAYVVQGEAPPDELFIVNEDPKILGELTKSGKTVIIEGHYTIGADHLFIEKIDGKAYPGKE
jgi:hypothetical protein